MVQRKEYQYQPTADYLDFFFNSFNQCLLLPYLLNLIAFLTKDFFIYLNGKLFDVPYLMAHCCLIFLTE